MITFVEIKSNEFAGNKISYLKIEWAYISEKMNGCSKLEPSAIKEIKSKNVLF